MGVVNGVNTDLVHPVYILRSVQKVSRGLNLPVVVEELIHIELGVKVHRAVVACLDGRVYTLRQPLEVLGLQGLDVRMHAVLGNVALHESCSFQALLKSFGVFH